MNVIAHIGSWILNLIKPKFLLSKTILIRDNETNQNLPILLTKPAKLKKDLEKNYNTCLSAYSEGNTPKCFLKAWLNRAVLS